MPALCSSYDSGFPFRKAADILITTCIEWLQANKNSKVSDIRLVHVEKCNADIFEE